MHSVAQTVDEYINTLSNDRKHALIQLRALIKAHLPDGYEEGMRYGMIGYYVPFSRYPKTYNNQPLTYIALASQKNYISLYLMGVYGENEVKFKQAYRATGKKLDMGKSCIRFKSVDDLPLDLIVKTIEVYTPDMYIADYEKSRGIAQ